MNNGSFAPSNILVTGGSGLLGRELITQLLASGKKVTAIYNKTPLQGFSSPGITTVKCDILDTSELEDVMAGIDELYHCAGKVSFKPNETDRLYKINVEGTANVVNAALDAGVRKMVHVSSVASLGRIRNDQHINEQMQWSEETSNSKYGESKFLGELEVWRGIAEGLNAVIVNPSIILGAGNWHESSTAIFRSVYNEMPWYTDGSSGFVDVTDVARAMIMLMESEITAERFILNGENREYHDVFNMIADAFSKKRPSKKVTPLLAAVVWRMEAMKSKFTGATPLITKETTASAFAKVGYDNSKIKSFLPGFCFKNLDETIANTCSVLQQKLNNH